MMIVAPVLVYMVMLRIVVIILRLLMAGISVLPVAHPKVDVLPFSPQELPLPGLGSSQ